MPADKNRRALRTAAATDPGLEPSVHLYLVVLRLTDSGRMARAHDTLRALGERIRTGVYEVACTPTTLSHLERALGTVLMEGDVVRIYPICRNCRRSVRLYGEGDLAHLPLAWIF